MKVENVSAVKKKFEPIELQITIESKEEFMVLWHRLNMPTSVLTGATNEYSNFSSAEDQNSILFNVLNEIRIDRGIEK